MYNNLDEVLTKEGILKSEFAKKCGLSESTIRKVAGNKKNPKLTNQYLIVKTLNNMIGENKYTVDIIFIK